LAEITADFISGRRANRLVQGDVGSGKTAIAMAAAFLAARNGYQAAIMAPTDVLARQLHAAACEYFAPLGYEAVLLLGGQTRAVRKEALDKTAACAAHIIVGTHALLTDSVQFSRLGLVVTDEQHRFGVRQRAALSQKGAPHVLVMTATPIPRTLGLILYGDLDISVVNSLPPGRIPIKTYHVTGAYRERILGFISRECAAGRQAYIICPAIERENEIKSVSSYADEIKKSLPALTIAALHSKLPAAEKEQTMGDFKAGEIQVLVSTTVIEVGVHVANATLMIIENAERFGLSQLHQLRGRVGRGTHQSYCILVSDAKAAATRERLTAMTQTTCGFALARADLEMRGHGDFFGTRQHGLPDMRIANLYRDLDILELVREAAEYVTL
jgi:ATP-dependent DNA helicase RecG